MAETEENPQSSDERARYANAELISWLLIAGKTSFHAIKMLITSHDL